MKEKLGKTRKIWYDYLKTFLREYSPWPIFSHSIPFKGSISSNLSSLPSLLNLYIKSLTSLATIWLNLVLNKSTDGRFDWRYMVLSKIRICSRNLYPSQFLRIIPGVLLIWTMPKAFSVSSSVLVLRCDRVGCKCAQIVLTKEDNVEDAFWQFLTNGTQA